MSFVFRDHRQRSQACELLVSRIHSPAELWTRNGPSDAAIEFLEENGGALSQGERVLLLAAFALWDADETLCFQELARLDSKNLQLLGGLLLALAGGATDVEIWLELNGQER